MPPKKAANKFISIEYRNLINGFYQVYNIMGGNSMVKSIIMMGEII